VKLWTKEGSPPSKWCRPHLALGLHVCPDRGDLCWWCYRFSIQQGYEPPPELIMRRDAGQRITRVLIQKTRPATAKPLARRTRPHAACPHVSEGQCRSCGLVSVRLSKGVNREDAGKVPPDDAVCEICGSGKRLCLDHDHITGAFRGWLCATCNSAIGMLRDDPVLIRRAADYVEAHQSSLNSAMP
jgi:hypothetical protein